MENASLGADDEFFVVTFLHVVDHAGGGSNVMGYLKQMSFGLRVSYYFRVWKLLMKFEKFLNRKRFVYNAGSIPQHHIPSCLADEITAEVLVRSKNDRHIRRDRPDNLFGIRG